MDVAIDEPQPADDIEITGDELIPDNDEPTANEDGEPAQEEGFAV